MTSAVLVALWSLNFAGGDDNLLVASLAKSFSKPAVLLADGRKPWPAVRESGETEASLLSLLRSKFVVDAQEGLGASPRGWPTGFALKQAHNVYALNKVIYPEMITETSRQRISVLTAGKSVFQLHQIRLAGPKLKWHWFYNSAYLCGVVRDSPTEAFLQGLSFALGAKLTRLDESPYLAFDPAAFKRRSIAAAQDPARAQLTGLDIEIWFRAQVIKDMTEAEITKAFGSSVTRTRRPAGAGTALHRACLKRVEWLYGKDLQLMQTIRANSGDNPIVQAVMDAGGAMSVSIRNRHKKWGILL